MQFIINVRFNPDGNSWTVEVPRYPACKAQASRLNTALSIINDKILQEPDFLEEFKQIKFDDENPEDFRFEER